MPNKANPKLKLNCKAGSETTYSVKSYGGHHQRAAGKIGRDTQDGLKNLRKAACDLFGL